MNSFIGHEPFSLESGLGIIPKFSKLLVFDRGESANRSVSVFSSHRQFQGFRWSFDGKVFEFFAENFLCFGLACAPAIFNQIPSAIATMLRRRGYRTMIHLDDFWLSFKQKKTAKMCKVF